jgi:lysine-N-methylase
VVHLFDDDRRRILNQGWEEKLEAAPMIRWKGRWMLNKRSNGACVFLDDDNRCRIHAEFGPRAKPLACQVFPFSLRRVDDHLQATIRFDCPSVARSSGDALQNHASELRKLGASVPAGETISGPVEFQRRRPASTLEIHELTASLVSWFRAEDLPFRQRLKGAARIATTLGRTRLATLEEDELVALVRMLVHEISLESDREAEPPLPRQCLLFRQLVFAHVEHVSLDDLLVNAFARFTGRFRQLWRARRYSRGTGLTPGIRGVCGETTFERIEGVRLAPGAGNGVSHLMTRYVLSRILGDAVFGGGYYGWSVVNGLSALFLSLVVTGYLSRMIAAAEARDEVEFDDVIRALALVDSAATRLPALGTVAERTRIAYLWENDGIARLVERYSF